MKTIALILLACVVTGCATVRVTDDASSDVTRTERQASTAGSDRSSDASVDSERTLDSRGSEPAIAAASIGDEASADPSEIEALADIPAVVTDRATMSSLDGVDVLRRAFDASSRRDPWSRASGYDKYGIETAATFDAAKRRLYREVYSGTDTEFYCGCTYRRTDLRVTHRGCFSPEDRNDRSGRIEAEHLVPAATIGATRACWFDWETVRACATGDKRGRKCCETRGVDDGFVLAHNDLHNLVPAIGEVNAARSNHPFTDTESLADQYGVCDFEMIELESSSAARPSPSLRGEIARAHLYMVWAHDVDLTREYLDMMVRWDREDPPTCAEVLRSATIGEIQGVSNPFVDKHPNVERGCSN